MSYIFGKHHILEALKSGADIEKIYIRYGSRLTEYPQIRKLSKDKSIKIQELQREKFDRQFGAKNTQGIVGILNNFKYLELEDLIEKTKRENNFPILVLLENIQDSNNLGAIIRSAECFGINGVIITRDNSAPLDEKAGKASAGAVQYIPVSKITNVQQAIKILKKNGFWIFGTSDHGDKIVNDLQISSPVVLLFGNENKGLKRLTLEQCDEIVRIPLTGKISSLNVSVSAGIIFYELNKKRVKGSTLKI